MYIAKALLPRFRGKSTPLRSRTGWTYGDDSVMVVAGIGATGTVPSGVGHPQAVLT